MKNSQTIFLSILFGVLILPIAGFVAWVRPGMSGVLAQGKSPTGQEFCVVQTYKGLTEPYQVSFYIRDADRIWRWNYLEHQGTAWRNASVEFADGEALVFRNGKPFRKIAMPTDTVDLATVPGGYVDYYCPPEFSVQDVLVFHNQNYK
ncbi:MAG: hypothetical protein QF489_06545 [Planctomycetota bacterium]|jgi:hypothetical protein|nr:hypothetical protein [Planctomycetota bacterium]